METVSLWESTTKYHETYPALNGEVSTDVVIIGAGFTGISASYHLQEKSINTIVLEQETVGWGASGRNGGMMNTGYKLSASDLIAKWGADEAKRLDQYALDSITAVKTIAEKNQIDCNIHASGHVALSTNRKSLDTFKHEQEVTSKHFDREVEVLNPQTLQDEVSTSFYQAGLFDPLSHSFHPLNYVRGLAKAASEHGASIYEHSPAVEIQKTSSGFTVYTEEGVVHAKEVIAATDGYSKKLVKELNQGVLPISSFVIATEVLDEETLSSLIPEQRNLFETNNLTTYFRQTPDFRILLGGSGITYPAKKKFFTELRSKLIEIFPQLSSVKIDYQWGGLIGATIDKFPVIGKTKDGIYYATGYTGHGGSQATLHGQLLAQAIMNETRTNELFENTKLKRIPFSSQKEFLIHSANLYFRFLDRLG